MSDYAMDLLSPTPPLPEMNRGRSREREEPGYSKASGGGRQSRKLIYPSGPRLQVVSSIETPERCYWLARTLALDVEYHDEEGVIVRHSRLPVSGHGDELKGALEDFARTFDLLYRRLEQSQDRLSPHAGRVWRMLQDFVESAS